MKKYIKKVVQVTIYRLWNDVEFGAMLKHDFIKVKQVKEMNNAICILFEDDQKGKFVIDCEHDYETIGINREFPGYIWKSKNDTVICVSGDRHWLTDRKYFEENYEQVKGEE